MRLIDANGAFFTGYRREVINWSKAPFDNLEHKGKPDQKKLAQITKEFTTFVQVAKQRGFTGILVDDLAHLVTHDIYPESLNKKLRVYKTVYDELFRRAKQHGLKIYITTDILFFTQEIREYVKHKHDRAAAFLATCTRKLFTDHEVDGIVVRIGESDGIDVQGDFKSELIIKTPKDLHTYTKALLTVAKEYDKLVIMRTWSLGAHPIGDVLWNEKTFKKAFGRIRTDHLVLSIKHGESDFFRHLPVNPLFFATKHKKIIEFQTRREYEGFGAYPSFIGSDIQDIRAQLPESVIGTTILCQTGGWSRIRRRTYLDTDGIWNALNTDVASQLIQGKNLEQAIAYAHKMQGLTGTPEELKTLLLASERIVKKVLYIKEVAKKDLFFRRARIPPLLWIFWDNVIISDEVRTILTTFVDKPQERVTKGKRVAEEILPLIPLAKQLGLPVKDIQYMYDTFTLIARARAYVLTKRAPSKQFLKDVKKYQETYPHAYMFDIQNPRRALSGRALSIAFRILHRNTRDYRLLDKALHHPTRLLGPLLMRWHKKHLPEFAKTKGMGASIFFH